MPTISVCWIIADEPSPDVQAHKSLAWLLCIRTAIATTLHSAETHTAINEYQQGIFRGSAWDDYWPALLSEASVMQYSKCWAGECAASALVAGIPLASDESPRRPRMLCGPEGVDLLRRVRRNNLVPIMTEGDAADAKAPACADRRS
jgi:hypothetical protein